MNYIEPIVTCFAAIVYLVLFIWVSSRLNKVEEKVFNVNHDDFIDSVISKCLRSSNLALYKDGEEVWVDASPTLRGYYEDYRTCEVTFSLIDLLNKSMKDLGGELKFEPSVTGLDRVTIGAKKG